MEKNQVIVIAPNINGASKIQQKIYCLSKESQIKILIIK